MTKKLLDHLTFLYGENESTRLLERTKNLLSKYRPRIKSRNSELSEQDSILITYGDQIQASNEKPLQNAQEVLRNIFDRYYQRNPHPALLSVDIR
ncbi:MAG: hypothetical protein IPO36_07085 [Anaerolineales bacterium]|nr:hypothetical protein [Anaerolineales bacterium]